MSSEDERRLDTRKHSYAKAFLTDRHVIGYIRDISIEGFRLEALGTPAIEEGEEVKVVFIPHEESKFPPFTIRGKVMWSAENPPTCSFGIAVIQYLSPGSRRLFRKFRRLWLRLFH
jgi:hypothetical protein